MNRLIEKYDKLIRIITIAPFMALLLLLAVYFGTPGYGVTKIQLAVSIVFLVILPVLAYPLQPFIPGFKDGGRAAQRKLAIITALVGYVLGLIFAFVFTVPDIFMVIYLTYLISGLAVALFSKLTHIKASGHACGIMGPIAVGLKYLGLWALSGLVLYALAFLSSVRMKRHTVSEFIIGSIIPVAALFVSVWLCGRLNHISLVS
ncbi:MAG: hypothetical protein ACI3VB_09830 [Oscillospiraceae bacterium]